MNLLNPAALFWLLLAVPIVIFYVLKIRMRRMPVSTVMFWQQVFDERQPRSLWQKLRHLFSLLLQLLFLLLIAVALTDPTFTWESQEQRRTILVIDNSASMQATDVLPSRLASAQQAADNLISRLRPRDEMAIVTASPQPAVLCGLTNHLGTLRKARERVSATDGPTRLAAAIDLGRRLLAGHAHGSIAVISDGCVDNSDALLHAPDIAWQRIGTTADNVGITRFQVRRSVLDPVGYQVLAEVRNFSGTAVDCRLELQLGDQLVDVIPLKLEPDGRWMQTIEQVSSTGGRLTARLIHADALAVDNTAVAVLPDRRRIPVVLVTAGNVFLQRVFEAHPLVDLTVVDQPPENIPGDAVVVFHKSVPKSMPRANAIVLQPSNSTELWELGAMIETPLVGKQDHETELLAHVKLDNVLMPEARQILPTRPARLLITAATGEPLYLAFEHAGQRVLVLTVNLEKGDLPLRTAFPILFANALTWFEGAGGELREALATGSVTEIKVPDSLAVRTNGQPASLVSLQSPGANQTSLPVADGKVTIGPLAECGIWQIAPEHNPDGSQPAASAEAPALEIACNLTNAAESRLSVPPNHESRSLSNSFAFARPVWFHLVLLAWLLTGLEWFLYHRRWIT